MLFFYMTSEIIGVIAENIRRNNMNRIARKEAYKRLKEGNNPYHIYYDWQGQERDLSTNKRIDFYHERGRYYRKEVDNGLIRDLTQENLEKEIKNEANKITGRIALEEYDKHRLYVMWNQKFYDNNITYNMPDMNDNIGRYPKIYRHCKTNRLCFLYDLNKEKNKKIWCDIISEIISIDNNIVYPCAYIDLFTGEILDLVDYSGNRTENKFGYLVIKIDEIKEIHIREYFSNEINDAIVQEYNKRINSKKYNRITTKWEILFH